MAPDDRDNRNDNASYSELAQALDPAVLPSTDDVGSAQPALALAWISTAVGIGLTEAGILLGQVELLLAGVATLLLSATFSCWAMQKRTLGPLVQIAFNIFWPVLACLIIPAVGPFIGVWRGYKLLTKRTLHRLSVSSDDSFQRSYQTYPELEVGTSVLAGAVMILFLATLQPQLALVRFDWIRAL